MPDEKRKDDDEIQDILSDLDSILSETPAAAKPAASPPPAPAPLPPVAKPPEPPKPAAAPPPAPVAPPPAMKIELSAPKVEAPKQAAPPPPPPPAAAPPAMKIELAAPSVAPPPPPAPAPKPVEPPKPVAAPPPAPKPIEPPKPAPAPASAPAPAGNTGLKPAAALAEEVFPEKTPKSQIRRVAYIYLDGKFEKERDLFAAFLVTTAQTVSKKPLFLRKVLFQPVDNGTDVTALMARIQETKAVAVMGLLEGMNEAKLKDITDAIGNVGLMFRQIPPAEVQKRAVAVDIIVDMMLLSPEE